MLKSGAGMDTTRILNRMQRIQKPLLLNPVPPERLGVEVTPQSHGLLEYPTENGRDPQRRGMRLDFVSFVVCRLETIVHRSNTVCVNPKETTDSFSDLLKRLIAYSA